MAVPPYSWIKLDKIEGDDEHLTSYPLVIYFGRAKDRQGFIALLNEAERNDCELLVSCNTPTKAK